MSVGMEQLGSNRTDFHEIWYLSIFRKAAQKIKVLLMSEKINRGTVHEEKYRFFIVSRSVLLRMRNIPDNLCTKSKHTIYVQWSFLEIPAIYETVWKSNVCPDRPQMIIRRMVIACWTHKFTNTLIKCIIYCFATGTIGAWTHLVVTLYVHCLSCLPFQSINKYTFPILKLTPWIKLYSSLYSK
jgi:hypothetical protein